MIKVTTYLIIFIKRLCKFKKTKTLQIEVPTICISKEDKDLIIFSTIELLEHKIKIIK
jgi:hypothetical protein